jgi:hypothetical protein
MLEIDETKRRIEPLHLNWEGKINLNFDHILYKSPFIANISADILLQV